MVYIRRALEIVICLFAFIRHLSGNLGPRSGSVKTLSGTITYDEEWGYMETRRGGHLFWWIYFVNDGNERPVILWIEVSFRLMFH